MQEIDSQKRVETSARRVLLLAPQPFFLSRGTPLNVKAMAEDLAQAGYAVDLLAYPFGEDITLQGVTIHRCFGLPGIKSVGIGPSLPKFILDIPFSLCALWLVLTRRYDLLHGVEEGALVAGALGLVRRVPYVYDMDSSMPDQLKERGYVKSKAVLGFAKSIERFFLKRSKAVLTVCEALTKKAKSVVGNSVPVFQIEDFPVDASTALDDRVIRQLWNEFQCNGKKVIVYTGNFEQYQGIDLLLGAYGRFLNFAKTDSELSKHEYLLLLVGGGEKESPLRTKYAKIVERSGFSSSVVFAGNRPLEQMGAFMALADVLVSPRIEGENTPLKLYSYMQAERPVVATRIYSHTQVLSDEHSYLAEPADDDFANALVRALHPGTEEKNEQRAKVERAYRLVTTTYSREAFRRKLVSMYQSLLGDESFDTADSQLAKQSINK